MHLTGGLGNQLFQVFNALRFLDRNQKILIDTGNGSPVLSEMSSNPIIQDFLSDDEILFEEIQYDAVTKKNINFLLRLSSNYKQGKVIENIFLKVINSLLKINLRKSTGTTFSIIHGKGVGEINNIEKIKHPIFLLGYFQYDSVANLSLPIMRKRIKFKYYQKELLGLIEDSYKIKPLVVHVRLGDYRKNMDFGLLSGPYYKKAIEMIWNPERNKEIWFFSDEKIDLEDYVPSNLLNATKQFQKIDNSDSATFEAMRYGWDYVIANSTYSWWAARLSYNDGITVIAPKPWFKSKQTPTGIYPAGWIISNSDFR